ncbi:MotA/TolQ/ExbB proton channel family protein [Candidatus Palauibacter sp.]|uniref:MotA/TolQ/ExbB proton channel family protein n=1 Tax=Candidatus Palauibacter sp. TaxID=3101350 RepID=UPI003AF1F21F
MDILDFVNPFPSAIVPNSSIVFLYLMLGFAIYGWFGLRRSVGLGGVRRRGLEFMPAVADIRAAGPESPSHLSPFAPDSVLTGLWSQFAERYEAGTVTFRGSMFGVTAPEEIFVERAVLRGYNGRLSLALSAIFAGLGILGTFWGLYLGLKDIGIPTQEELFESVQTLLSGMSAAFVTSLAGIALSLFWRILHRSTHHKFQRRAHAFFAAVRVQFPVRTPETVLAGSLRMGEEQRVLLEEQKGILQNLGTDLASAMQDAMEKSFSPALTSIDETLRAVTTQVDQRQMEALDDMVVAFREQFLGAADEQIQRLATAVQGASEWQERVNDDVRAVFERVVTLSDVTATLVESGGSAAERFLGSLDGLRESHTHITETTEHLRDIAGRTAATSSRLGKEVDAFTEANMELRTALASQLDETRNQVDRLIGFWNDLKGNLDALATTLEGSLTEFTSVTQEKLQEIFARFDTEMATVVNHLSGTLAELREATEDLVPGVIRAEEAISESLAPVRASEEKLAALTDSLLALEPLPASLSTASDRAKAVEDALRRLQSAFERRDGRQPEQD